MSAEHKGTLHIHAQAFAHDEAWVVGDRDGLVALRDAIDAALAGQPNAARSFTADGEGFVAIVICAEMGDAEMLPYAEPVDGVGGAVHPRHLLADGEYRKLVLGR